MDYPFQSIRLNGREVTLAEICSKTVFPQDDFERNTFDFIGKWFQGQVEFYLRTSGSTGTAKNILISRDQMIASATATAHALDLQRGMRAAVCLDTQFIAGQMMLVRCFNTGMSIDAVSPTADPLKSLGFETPVDFIALVPLQVQTILSSTSGRSNLSKVKTMIIGGAPLSQSEEDLLGQFPVRAFMTYGMTETISHIALRRINGTSRSNAYTTLPGITVRTDERSCLIANCPYIRAEVVTNDLVRLVNNTSFEWIGRVDNVINSGGLKIAPEVLEAQIVLIFSEMKMNGRFIISSMPDATLGEKVVLVLEGSDLKKGENDRIMHILQESLPKYHAPRLVASLSAFPLTPTGKINRREVRALLSKNL